MDNKQVLDCRRCGSNLTGEVDAKHLTVCPQCGKRWQLTEDHAAIQDTPLIVNSVGHASKVPRIGEY